MASRESSKQQDNEDAVALETWAKRNLGLSTIAMFIFGHAVSRPHVASVPLGMLGSDQGHFLMLIQALNIWRISKYHPSIFSQWYGRIALLVNTWSFGMLFNHLWESIGARRAYTEGLRKQGIQPRAGSSSGIWWYIFSLLPLMAVSRRGKPIAVQQNIRYADMEKVDPALLKSWKKSTRVWRNSNMILCRGRVSQWLSLDVLQLEGLNERGKARPILMSIHGGAWLLGDKSVLGAPAALRLASRGVIVVMVNYRMSPECAFPAQILDCKRALIFVKKHASEWGGDPNRVFVCGESAGGHLSALMGCTPNLAALQPPEYPDADTSVAGCLPLYGLYDISGEKISQLPRPARAMMKLRQWFFSLLITQQAFSETNMKVFDLASPIYHLRRALEGNSKDILCPFFISHGTQDVLASYDDATVFYNELQQYRAKNGTWTKGESDVFVEIALGLHGFGLMPSPRANALADSMADFIFHHMKRLDGGSISPSVGKL